MYIYPNTLLTTKSLPRLEVNGEETLTLTKQPKTFMTVNKNAKITDTESELKELQNKSFKAVLL